MNNEESERLRARLERLPTEIKQYYGAYFSELRSQLARPDLFSEAVPGFLKGYKRVISIGGRDGLVVVHFPIELETTFSETDTGRILIRFPSVPNAEEDAFEFITFRGETVSVLVNFISEGEDINIGISPGVSWGAKGFAAPQEKFDLDTGQLIWQAPWTRIVAVDFYSLDYFGDPECARAEAREDVEPYVRGSVHKELDEIRAPEGIEDAGVRAGDRGVVIEVFERPSPALLVEYADLIGQTKALVTYSMDLETILDVFVDRDFLTSPERTPEPNETMRDQPLDFPADSPVVKGLVAA